MGDLFPWNLYLIVPNVHKNKKTEKNMAKTTNPIELYGHLKKTNCRECRLPSCMAFAVAVIQGKKDLGDCPYVDAETIHSLQGRIGKKRALEEDREITLSRLKQAVAEIDFSSAAIRLDADLNYNGLTINCLGKDFRVDSSGEMIWECHQNAWVQIPVLNYILHGKGKKPTGEWVAFRELKGAAEWGHFFSHRCEEALRRLVDAHKELIFEILYLFGAKPLSTSTNADRSLVIHPLPTVPFLVNYWEPEEDFQSKLNILFDRSTPDNLNIESVYLLGRGLVEMFRVLIVQHSKDGTLF